MRGTGSLGGANRLGARMLRNVNLPDGMGGEINIDFLMESCPVSSYSHAPSMPWTYSAETDVRFSRIVRINLIACLLLCIVILWLPLTELKTPVIEEPPRLATLILEVKPTPPSPKPVAKPEPKPVVKPKPVPVAKEKIPPKNIVKQVNPVKNRRRPGR